MKKRVKTLVSFTMSLVFCLVTLSSVSYASEKDSSIYALEKTDAPSLASETVVFLPNFENALYYYATMFTQSQNGNNCGPTAAANVLSYFKGANGVNLYSGKITQSTYNQICTDCNYSPTSANSLLNTSNGIKAFANRAGYTCKINMYMLNLFSDVKRDIKRGYPVLAWANDHAFVIVGYSEGGSGGNKVYVCTGWENPLFEWYELGNGVPMCSINIY